MDESENRLSFTVTRQAPRRRHAVMRRPRLMQLLVVNVRVTLRAGELGNNSLLQAFGHAQRIDVRTEVQQLVGGQAHQRRRFARVAAVGAFQP